jgi:glycosyltransferase involved in cell wall biosynthesis
MKLFSLTVVKNEADRYLDAMLQATCSVVDEMFVFDDQSSDDTVAIAMDYATYVCERIGPSFLENEGRFRQSAWSNFEDCCAPVDGDWVLVIDADEILVAGGNVRDEVDRAIKIAESIGAKSVRLPVPEVFGLDVDGTPLVRTDGWWGTIAGTRLFRYQSGGVYRDKAMGSGGEPVYVPESRISEDSGTLSLMHFGYCDKADQVAKHERYTSLLDHGHADSHVASIVQPPTLQRWTGPTPAMWRGIRSEAA